MIVYRVIRWAGTKPKTRKMRTSDKNKRFYDNFHKRRGQSYWWKGYEPVDENSNTVQEHM
jgi:hypothetical protein